MTVATPDFYDVIDGTWPAKDLVTDGPWILRDGDSGGKRVSAATATGPVGAADIDLAEAAMRARGQNPLFMLRDQDELLDAALAERGYRLFDRSTIYACDAKALTDIPLPRVTVFTLWEPLAIMHEIWAAGGIDAARFRVMGRAQGPKTAMLARRDEMPAGVGFVAIHNGVAMVHAVEVLPHQRRKGAAAWMMRAAAFWATKHEARTLSVICTEANEAANALYSSLGFSVVGQYHYRQKPED